MTAKDILMPDRIKQKVLEDKVFHTVQNTVSWNMTLTVSGNIHDVKSFVFIDLYRETETE